MKSSTILGGVALGLLSLVAPARAEEPPLAPPASEPATAAPPAAASTSKIQLSPPVTDAPPRKIDLSTPPAAPRVQRSYHMHDGFYLRASAGIGSLRLSLDDGSSSGEDLKGSGFDLGFDVMAGGSPTPGVAIGGALLVEAAGSARLTRSGERQDRSGSLLLIGPFIDGFPSANRGLHFGGMLGLARIGVDGTSEGPALRAAGFGAAAWFGNDFWVADDWSVGPLLRLSAAYARRGESPELSATTFSVMALVTALYH